MIALIGGLLGATNFTKLWALQPWAFLVRVTAQGMAQVWSAFALSDRALQPAFVKRNSRHLQHWR